MPDLTLVRPCALIALLAACGSEPVLLDGELFRADAPLTISGQVLDGEGRPLWDVEVAAVEQRTNHPPTAVLGDRFDDPRRTGTDVYGDYTIEVDAVGPIWLHFGTGLRTFAWLEVDAGRERKVDVVLAEDDVVHCQLFSGGERNPISSYSMWTTGPNYGFGMGGGCISSHGTCGAEALTFIWPSGYQTVEVHMGDADEVVLTGFDEPCEADE